MLLRHTVVRPHGSTSGKCESMKMYRRQLRLLRNILYLRENSRVKVNEARQVHGFGDSRGGDGGHSDDMAFDANISDKTVSTKEVISDKRVKRKAFVNARFPILLFPGQGSQFVGMGKKALHYPGVKEMYEEISEHFRKDILKLCLLGPKEELDKTINCQPAVFITSLAAVEMMKELYPEVLCHSLQSILKQADIYIGLELLFSDEWCGFVYLENNLKCFTV